MKNKTVLGLTLLTISIITSLLTFTISKVSAQKKKQMHITPVTQQANLASLRQMTERIIALYEQASHSTNPGQRQGLMNQLQGLTDARNQLLLALMRYDPDQLLQVALPGHILAALPEGLREYFEQEADLDGELEVLLQENGNQSELIYTLTSDSKKYNLHFRPGLQPDLLSGSRVGIRGVRVGEEIAVSGEALALDTSVVSEATTQQTQSSSSVMPNTFGAQKVIVILVNFQDKATQPYTVADARNVLSTASNYYLETSYGQTWLTGDVTGWYTIPVSSTTCNTSSIATYAKQAAQAAGYNLSAYNRFVYAFPDAACNWAGWGTIGGSPSSAWINGSFTSKVLAHELGHNFGLYHSRYLNCSPSIIGTNCTTSEYGDSVDVMGIIDKSGHFNAYQKTRLGWLNYGISPPTLTVSSSGVYSIDAYETAGSNPKALRIRKSIDPATGMETWYWIEFRRPLGFDSFVSTNSNLLNGVVVHQQSDSSGAENYLLDMTPGSSNLQFDPALVVGQSFSDANAGVTLSVLSVSSSGATVGISFGPQLCVRGNPSVTISPSTSQWVSPGSTVSYQVSLTNNDSGGCAASSFDLQSTAPTGWSALFDNSTITLSSGAKGSTTLRVTSPSSAANGYYTIGVNAANSTLGSYVNSCTVTCSIMSGLSVAVVTNQESYATNQSASITASVTSAGAPVSGATVAFTITKPNGTKATGSATTGATGSAVFKYRFNKQKDPKGTYQVAAGANFNGALGSGVTSFTLK